MKPVIEIKCTCKECGKIWHYLQSEEESMKKQAGLNSLVALGNLFNPTSAYYSNKSIDTQRKVTEKFYRCPSCNSANITKEKHEIEAQ
ncbi:MAG: hypothetical protein V1494_05820 [Candidatus Diapherotrites archaeon]